MCSKGVQGIWHQGRNEKILSKIESKNRKMFYVAFVKSNFQITKFSGIFWKIYLLCKNRKCENRKQKIGNLYTPSKTKNNNQLKDQNITGRETRKKTIITGSWERNGVILYILERKLSK